MTQRTRRVVGEVLALILGTTRVQRWVLAVLEEEQQRSIWLMNLLF